MNQGICSDPFRIIRPLIQRIYALIREKKLQQKIVNADFYRHSGLELIVLPGVFHPYHFITGHVFADLLHKHLHKKRYERVLDMGTGSGVIGITMSQYANSVDSVDINSEAVRCARMNARYHSLENKMTVYEGNLFSPFDEGADLKYDLMLFNPPFYTGQAEYPLGHALYGGLQLDVITRFARSAPLFLKKGGKVIFLLSTAGSLDKILSIMKRNGYSGHCIDSRECFIERIFMIEFSVGS